MIRHAIWVALSTITISAVAQEKNTSSIPTVNTVTPTDKSTGINEKIKTSRKISGLFTLYQDTITGSLQLYIKKDQLEKEFIYQSFSLSGPTAMFLNQNMYRFNYIFKIQKMYDKLAFSEVNTSFYYNPDNAVSKAANVDVPETVFYSNKIAVEDSSGYLITCDDLFISEKLDPVKPVYRPETPPTAFFNLGSLNIAKSRYEKIRSYSNNTDIIVRLAYDNPTPYNGGGKDITDARYNSIKIQHSFMEIPVNDFRPRYDDPRVGYFTNEIDDLTSTAPVPFKDVINRWHLKKKDPTAPISEPVEPIVYWIENTTPVELRQTIIEAGEKWNEAFEKAGFKNAIVMKVMPDSATWDPADIRYNTIRWVSSAESFYDAIGLISTNPRTGQILGADITIEWASVADALFKNELYNATNNNMQHTSVLSWDQYNNTAKEVPTTLSSNNHYLPNCTIGTELQSQYVAGLTAIEALDNDIPEEQQNTAVTEMYKQYLTSLVLHEMGHTLGLTHNMKASQMLSPAEINNKEITHRIGMMGSVMDYDVINISLDRNKQGDYFTTKPGPYDLWAIEYGYKPFKEAEENNQLHTILNRSTEPQLAFGNDADDMRYPGYGIDPRIMVMDMSNDMIAYAEERLKLVNTMMPRLKNRFSRNGQSYQELFIRYKQLCAQRTRMLNGVSRYIGGVYVDRSFVGQHTNSKPYTPVSASYQKSAMELLNKYLFAPNAFDADTTLFPYLQIQRRGFNFRSITEDPKPQNTYLSTQLLILTHILHPNTLQRINTSSLYGNTYRLTELMNDLIKGIFDNDLKTSVNLYRQNLQTEFVKNMITISSINSNYDNPSKSVALDALKKIKSLLTSAVSPDQQTKIHRNQLLFIIDKVLKPAA